MRDGPLYGSVVQWMECGLVTMLSCNNLSIERGQCFVSTKLLDSMVACESKEMRWELTFLCVTFMQTYTQR